MEALVASKAAQVIIPIITGILASQPGGEGVATGLRTAGMMGNMSTAFGAGDAASGFAASEKARLTEELNRRQGMEGIQQAAMSPQQMAAGNVPTPTSRWGLDDFLATPMPGEGGLVGPPAPQASDLYGLPTEASAARATGFLDAMPGAARAAPRALPYLMDQATKLGAPTPTPKPTPGSLYDFDRVAARQAVGPGADMRLNFAEGSVTYMGERPSTPKENEPTASPEEQARMQAEYEKLLGNRAGTMQLPDGSSVRYKDRSAPQEQDYARGRVGNQLYWMGEEPGNASFLDVPGEEFVTVVNRDPRTGRMASQSQRR